MIDCNELPWQTRAEAAERTVDVLKRRLRAIDAGEEKTVIQRRLESAHRRVVENDRRRAISELRNSELQRYSARLEREVATRTEQIRTILDHVSAGFLLIGPSLTIEQGWSRSCELLLASPALGRTPLARALRWNDVKSADFEASAEQVFDDILPEELTTAQLPPRAEISGRVLHLEYSVVRVGGAVARILVTITDVTAQAAAERDARRHRVLVQILTQREAFRMFVFDTRRMLSDATDAHDERDDAWVRRAVHTIKGNAASFGLDELARLCHEVEGAEIEREGLARISEALSGFLTEHRDVLGIDPSDEACNVYTLSKRDIEAIIARAGHHDERGIQQLLSQIRSKPAGEFVGPIRAAVVRLSDRLSKDVDFEVRGADVTLDPERLGPVLRCLPHLVRNALDHGLEMPAERGEKSTRGRLALNFAANDQGWSIEVVDDGRGIDPRRVADAAVRRGFLSVERAATLTRDEVMTLLTANGFSTVEEVTEISGRGVGLSAVREAVEGLGGDMVVESEVGQGTTFRLQVPRGDALARTGSDRR